MLELLLLRLPKPELCELLELEPDIEEEPLPVLPLPDVLSPERDEASPP